MTEENTQTNLELKGVLNQPYKYGFQTEIEMEQFPIGINEDILTLLSTKKKEPSFLFDFRLKAYKKWKTMTFPEWANLAVNPISYNDITY